MNNSHSIIDEYPINYNNFPLAKECKEFKIELKKNQYIVIPKYWYHWIITESRTLSVSYQIIDIEFNELNNDFNKSIINSLPFVKLIEKNDISYQDFINNSLNFNYNCIFSENYKCSPVNKNSSKKFFYETLLKNIIYISDYKKYYSYIGNNKILNNNILAPYNNIDYIIDKKYYNNIDYKPSVWFTLNNRIDSGLHNDPTDNIIYVLDGKKTFYLYCPHSNENLYITEYPLINKLKPSSVVGSSKYFL